MADPPSRESGPGETATGEHDSSPVAPDRGPRGAAVAVAAGSRLFIALVAVATTATVGIRSRPLWMRDPEHIEVFGGALRHAVQPWANWDGVWFIRIAADGYGSHPFSQAFFPLYPLALRALGALAANSYVVAGVIVSLVCYAGAMVVLYRLAREDLGERVALWSVAFISVFPTAFFFQAVYSESLFLLLTLVSFSSGKNGRWWLAGAAGLLAALTRSAGALLVLPLAVLWWEQRRGCAVRLPGGPSRAVRAPRPPTASLGWLLLVPVGLVAYMAYLWLAFGDALLFGAVQGHWGRTLSPPSLSVWRGATAAFDGVRWLLEHGVAAVLSGPRTVSGGLQSDVIANPLEFLALVAAVALLVACWRRLPAAYTVYALAAVLLPLLYATPDRPLSSLPRFLVVIFPLFIALAAVLVDRAVWRWLVAGAFSALLVLATVLFASFI